ncbi:MAG TPA: hypothetical protein VEA18_01250 [Candidatus Kapabacteria bacterium]|nr:hypothetical protein [Candidatus Kapabacteria bacterium]
MFDDVQPKNPGQVPPNLPVGEPEDMFGGTGDDGVPTSSASFEDAPPAPPTPSSLPPTALEMGALRPKQPSQEQMEPQQPYVRTMPQQQRPQQEQMMAQNPELYRLKGPSLGRGIMLTVLALIVLVALGGGGWWLYAHFVQSPQAEQVDSGLVVPTTTPEVTPEPTTEETDTPSDISSEIIDEQVLFGEPIDTDNDGLDDSREQELGTDPNKWDTDGDELNDRDEVVVWKTDPRNTDTDGDTYADYVEVKSGYNPTGPGKLFQPPTSTKS